MKSTPLRVLHAVGWYFPESSGGTEVYVDALASELAQLDVHSSVVAASDDEAPLDYEWHGHAVHRYHVPADTSGDLSGHRPHERFDGFERWLTAQNADIYHQHSWTRGCGAAHLRLARQLGFKTVLTVHVPSVLCLRGTMMLNGEAACDGRVERERCTSCWGMSRGIPSAVATWQSQHPRASAAIARALPAGRMRTALATPDLVDGRIAQLAEIGQLADCVVAVCGWLQRALVLNGLPQEKVVYSAQGVDSRQMQEAAASAPREGRPYRVGFLGRWDPVKGVHILVNAFRMLPRDAAVELRVFALPGDADYERSVRSLAAGDDRIHFEQPLARAEIAGALRDLDLLAVPSLWLETGPLVALEAFAAGRPVLGSDLGGLTELVTPGVNGRLVPAGDVAAWSLAIAELMDAEPLSVPRPRTTTSVAADMRAVYDRVRVRA